MQGPMFVTAGMMALLLLEAIKFIWRKIVNDGGFEFPSLFYELLIPFLTAAWQVVFSLVPELGFPQVPPEELLSWQSLLQWGMAIMIELVFYHGGIEPLKAKLRSA